ncbi:Crp/Fnr family transcriptional regulator [Qipengyuania sediminis]|uniref:Crp/Fnr family transcriptional regulator n=1 Tax=Qipengyuania sediminis TaxID=1532023 RepID=UPI00105A1B90|nr:Crp/Fnr family transcriptional regulator [Qipengyuania sediminis]
MAKSTIQTPNLLLRALSDADRALIDPLLSRTDLQRETVLARVGEPTARLFFIEGGVASSVAIEGSTKTEVGLIGIDGVTGVNAVLGDDLSSFETFMQVYGGTALSIRTQDMRRLMAQSPSLREIMTVYAHVFMVQISYALVACAQHLMEARLARWLLMCHDRVEGDGIALTHEFMAVMIAAQRSGVTMTLHSLEGAGMIRSTRGLVTIRDRTKLVELAGSSYGIPERRYSALIAPFGKTAAGG